MNKLIKISLFSMLAAACVISGCSNKGKDIELGKVRNESIRTDTEMNMKSSSNAESMKINALGSQKGFQIVDLGKQFLGTPYVWGSRSGYTKTFDCSSFTQYIYRRQGIHIARGARNQYAGGTPVSRNHLVIGDLLFFSTPETVKYPANSINRIGHVGIYAGDNRVLHTYGEGGVKFSDIGQGWWKDHYVSAARY